LTSSLPGSVVTDAITLERSKVPLHTRSSIDPHTASVQELFTFQATSKQSKICFWFFQYFSVFLFQKKKAVM